MFRPKFIRHAGLFSLATLLSRILGYVRDALIANAFGGGHLTDAFYAAFRIPNLMRRLLGEGPLTSAFVPMFTEHLEKNNRPGAQKFFRTLFTTLAVILAGLVVVGILFAPVITQLIVWGFKDDPEKFNLTVRLTRLMFPFLLFVCLAAVSAGALNALGRFFTPALAPSMLSVAEIAFVLFFMRFFSNPLEGLAISALVGGVLHFGFLLPALKREGLTPKIQWDPHNAEVKKVGLALIPAIWGLSVDQVSAFIDTICASFLVEGSVTALYNSNRLMQFPLALFGIAVSTAALPSLAAAVARRNYLEMKQNLNLSLRMVFFAVVPAMVGLLILSRPLVELLFEHGRFSKDATTLTAAALAGYSLGLPAYAAVKVLVSAFYAMKDIRTPVRVATYCLLVNMGLNLILMWRYGVGGLAFSSAAASSINALALFWLMRRRLGLLGGRLLLVSFVKSLTAAMVMGLVALTVVWFAPGGRAVQVPLAVVMGACAYLASAWLLDMDEFHHVRELIQRQK